MSWSTVEIESRVLELLKAAEDVSAVRTWESEVREELFVGEQLSKGFRPGELPAVMVTTALEPTRSSVQTAGEIRYMIALQVIIVTGAQRREDARQQLLELMRAIERPLHTMRRSDVIGRNVFVQDELVSSHLLVQDSPRHYGVGNITTTVLKVVDL